MIAVPHLKMEGGKKGVSSRYDGSDSDSDSDSSSRNSPTVAKKHKASSSQVHNPTLVPNEGCSLLANNTSLTDAEEFGKDEEQLNQLMKTHTMLSMDAVSCATLQMVCKVSSRRHIKPHDPPVVPKSHDDMFLRPANKVIGERECVCGTKCICMTLATMRHGENSPLAFIGTEFLLPDEHKLFTKTGTLPKRRRKCLVCTRYYHNYIYILARCNPEYLKEPLCNTLQTFQNAAQMPPADPIAKSPTDHDDPSTCEFEVRNVSIICSQDGYRNDAMLFVDEAFVTANPKACEDAYSTLVWRPVVKFNSRHYRYVTNGKTPQMVQIGIGVSNGVADLPDSANLYNFQQPLV